MPAVESCISLSARFVWGRDSTRRFVVCLSMCHFVLVFFSPFSTAITSLGEERANLSAFRTFVRFMLVWICRFLLPLGVWEGLRFVIVALLDFSLTFFFYSIGAVSAYASACSFAYVRVCASGCGCGLYIARAWIHCLFHDFIVRI